MYLSPNITAEIERLYGVPRVEALEVSMSDPEFAFLCRSMRRRRAHDVTLYIMDQRRVAVIRKPSYPEGLFRAPSGGIEPEESFEAGAIREAFEETGLEITLERYVLRASVGFRNGQERVSWTTHVLTARPAHDVLNPQDTHEIAEARWISLEELNGPMRQRLLTSSSSGLRYRGHLDRLAMEEILKSPAHVTL